MALVAFVRLVPLFPFNLLNYASAYAIRSPSTYRLRLCMLPGAFAYTYLGYAGREAAAHGAARYAISPRRRIAGRGRAAAPAGAQIQTTARPPYLFPD